MRLACFACNKTRSLADDQVAMGGVSRDRSDLIQIIPGVTSHFGS